MQGYNWFFSFWRKREKSFFFKLDELWLLHMMWSLNWVLVQVILKAIYAELHFTYSSVFCIAIYLYTIQTKHTKTYSTYMSLYPLLSHHTLSFWWLKSSNFVWVILLEFNIFFAAIHQSMIYWLKIILEDACIPVFLHKLYTILSGLIW